MLRRLTILFVFVPLASIGILASQTASSGPPKKEVTNFHVSQNRQQRDNSQNDGQNATKSPSVVVQVNTPQGDANSSKNSETHKMEHENIQVEWVLAGLTGLLVIVGILQAVAFAGIANKQIDHMVASERAWILIHTEGTQLPTLIPIDGPSSTPGEHPFAQCMVSLKNFGRTPAHVSVGEFEMKLGDSNTTPPSSSIYETVAEPRRYTIGPKEQWPIQALLKPQIFINLDNMKELKKRGKFLWMCGVIRYSDVFEGRTTTHETRVCLLYDPNSKPIWVVSGPPQYNLTT